MVERELPAIVLVERGRTPVLARVVVAPPGPDEVRVQMRASGLCHTDLAAVRDARTTPVLLGHEGAGVVESVGEGVTHVRPGQPVVINWQVKCGQCRWCLAGRADLCENIQGTRAPRVHWNGAPLAVLLNAGTFCPLVVVPAMGAVPIRPDLPFELAALLGCAVATGVGAALYTARVAAGAGVVVIGAGGVGLNVIQGAALAHASLIIAVDTDPTRLAIARRCGATHVFDNTAGGLVDYVLSLTAGRGVEHAFEVVGQPALMELGLQTLARGGALTLIGAAARDADFTFRPRRFMSQQQTIQGCIYGNIRPALDLPLFADWHLSGRLKLNEIPTEAVRLDEVPGLFDGRRPARALRPVVMFEA
ncbi:MAG: alcohol dehydrogenase catalytic domain-containing protein [Anaerolineales bacterium]|nr:alcohol dehydrogenase catalytic domain-containing protein [Anaerolineales bacterium]